MGTNAAVVVLIAALAGCGSRDNANGDPARAVPPSAVAYAAVAVPRNASEQNRLAALLAGVGAGRLVDEVRGRAQRAESRGGIDLRAEAKPWLGRRVGLFVVGPGAYGVVVPAKDEADARDTAQTGDYAVRHYRGVEIERRGRLDAAVLDGFLVGGTHAAVRGAIDALKGRGLAESAAYRRVRPPGDRSATMVGYAAPGALGAVGGLAAVALGLSGLDVPAPVAAAVDLDPLGRVTVTARPGLTGRVERLGRAVLRALPEHGAVAFR